MKKKYILPKINIKEMSVEDDFANSLSAAQAGDNLANPWDIWE